MGRKAVVFDGVADVNFVGVDMLIKNCYKCMVKK